MIKQEKQLGFTAVELLISLFIAAAFLLSGYQLFNTAVKDSGDTKSQTIATNLAYEYLQRYSSSATSTCSALTPFNSAVAVPDLSNVTVTVVITCPYPATNAISKVTSTVQFNTPSKTVSISTYVKP